MAIPLESLLKPSPSLDEPLDMLEACHDRIEGQCRTLERMIGHIERHGVDTAAKEAAAGIIRYFDLAGENHHLDEELDLFPSLRACSSSHSLEVEALLAALLMEHERMRVAWRCQLRPQLADVCKGERALQAEVVASFTRLYRAHIEREEAELLPLARTMLQPEVLGRMSGHMVERRRAKTGSAD